MRGYHWYPWNYNASLANEDRANLSLAARGALADLRDMCASKGSVPKDRNRLARLLFCERAELDEIWEEIEPYFLPETDDENRMYHVEIRAIMAKQERRHKSQKSNGLKGGRPSTKTQTKTQQENPNENPTVKPKGETQGAGREDKTREDIEKNLSPKGSLIDTSQPAAAAFDTLDGGRLEPKPTNQYWQRVVKCYPKSSHIPEASNAWADVVELAADPLAEARKVADAAWWIDKRVKNKKWLPNLRDFIRNRRYLEDWEHDDGDWCGGEAPEPEDKFEPWVASWEDRPGVLKPEFRKGDGGAA